MGTLLRETNLAVSILYFLHFCCPLPWGTTLTGKTLLPFKNIPSFNPIALRRAKTLWSFGPSECNRINSRFYFGGDLLSREANGKSQKLSPFVKMLEIVEVCLYILI